MAKVTLLTVLYINSPYHMCKLCIPIPDQTYLNSTLNPFCILLLQFCLKLYYL